MTGEQFLSSIRCLDLEINAMEHTRSRLADRRRDILEQAESTGANLSGVCVQHGPASKTEALGVQLADLITPEELVRKLNAYQDRLNKKIDELIDRKQLAQDVIDKIPDARLKALLIHRYISSLRWPTVADLLGYNEHYVRVELKMMAIAAFEKNYQKLPIP